MGEKKSFGSKEVLISVKKILRGDNLLGTRGRRKRSVKVRVVKSSQFCVFAFGSAIYSIPEENPAEEQKS